MRYLICWAAMALLTLPSVAEAQLFGRKIDTRHVPKSAVASATLFPKKIATDPKFDLFPREIVTAWGQKEFGFDPMLLTQATFVIRAPESMQAPPTWAAILQFEEMQGLNGGLIDRLDQKKVSGKTLFSGASMGLPSFLVYDEATIFVGDEDLFGEMVDGGQSTRLVRMMKSPKAGGQLLAFAEIEQLRPMLKELMAAIPAMLPPAITRVKELPDMVKGVEFGFGVANGSLETRLLLHCENADEAERANKIVVDAMDLGKELAIGGAATQMDLSDPVQEATLEYMQRMANDYQKALAPGTTGSSVELAVRNEAAVVPVMIGLLLPAVQQTRSAARRTQSMNNSRQMMLALHNYASAHQKFPAQANYDENGRPLLSWRVHILPYIEQQALYEQFHLDEPWDSPHNRRLISKMPPVFQSPSVAVEDGKTVYLGISGENSPFQKRPLNFADFTDGTSNTVMVVEANPELAVEWTRPTDLEIDARDPMRGLGGVNPGGFIATMADGSTHFFSSSLDPETWRALTTVNGGEVADPYR